MWRSNAIANSKDILSPCEADRSFVRPDEKTDRMQQLFASFCLSGISHLLSRRHGPWDNVVRLLLLNSAAKVEAVVSQTH